MVLGLMLFNRRAESLFLLDEPDTHLNPQWTYRYFELVKRCFPVETSHLLIATHNPLMIGGLRANQVRVLGSVGGRAGGSDYASVVQGVQPDTDPFGMSIDGLLQSELYGLRSTLSPQVIEMLDRRATLLAKKSRTKEEEIRLRGLSDELAKLGVAITHPNPYFDEFAKALSRNELFKKPVLTAEESRQLESDTDALLKEIIEEGKRA